VVAKRGKISTGESTAVEDNKRMYMPVGRVVVVHCGHKLDGLAISFFEFQHSGDGQAS
jgi:hypothetical protein